MSVWWSGKITFEKLFIISLDASPSSYPFSVYLTSYENQTKTFIALFTLFGCESVVLWCYISFPFLSFGYKLCMKKKIKVLFSSISLSFFYDLVKWESNRELVTKQINIDKESLFILQPVDRLSSFEHWSPLGHKMYRNKQILKHLSFYEINYW